MTNQLINENSPYLLQHAENPVNWYPWGEAALQKAKAEDKPIFLSIGYSACHWCHVMAHESFEDEELAEIMNAHFINIKVDREERPDLDRIYMSAVQAMTGRGGWPLNVFLTPDLQPFYGGTYFPPTSRQGLPAFSALLLSIHDAWQHKRQELISSGEKLVAAIQERNATQLGTAQPLLSSTLETGFQQLRQTFDGVHGGWGGAPKFPQPMALEFLLRYQHVHADSEAGQMAFQTLEAMARGGMYDQLGGGFHRYAVDQRWLVPHFEKMLYDNAQLARVYLHAWQLNGDQFFRTIAEEILDYVAREMLSPEGGFYATQDADSEGEEGRFFIWSVAEIEELLGAEAPSFIAAYGVTEAGNFEGRNILEFVGELDQRADFAAARNKLLAARERRVCPARDEKIITSWNGLMLAAFAEAARLLEHEGYLQIAEQNAEFLLRELQGAKWRLFHTWKDGAAKVNGQLEDYAHLAMGLLELYQTTFDVRWYTAARELVETMIEHFSAPRGFFDTSDDHEKLIVRPRGLQDSALPSGNAMAAELLLRLAGLAVEPYYTELAHLSLEPMQTMLSQYPLGFAQWLLALDYALSHPREVAIIGAPDSAETRSLLELCTRSYRPHQVVAFAPPTEANLLPPLLQAREQIEGRATAYVCVDQTCKPPVTDPVELRALLAEE